MSETQEKRGGLLTSAFNILSNTGVQFAVGNALLFWLGGGVPQLATSVALAASLGSAAYSEFSKENNIFTDPNNTLKLVSVTLAVIAGDAALAGDAIPALTSTAFALGNLGVAGVWEGTRKQLSNVFGNAVAQIATKAETYYTAGLGLAAYMAAGDATVHIPGLNVDVPTSLLTFIPTAIGGSIAVRNSVLGKDADHGKPFMWLAGGVGATGVAGFAGGAMLAGAANGFFSSAYLKIQSEIEGSYKNLGGSIGRGCKNIIKRVVG